MQAAPIGGALTAGRAAVAKDACISAVDTAVDTAVENIAVDSEATENGAADYARLLPQ